MASELSMNGKKKIETLQKEFTQKFPYLTLVFLDKERRAIDISKSLSEVRQAKGADISIIASLKVNTIEKRFLENYGLIVEVAYQKSDKVVYTKDNVDKTLNELNKWCQENDCQPFEFKKSLTGNTLSSVQEQLFEAIKKYYPNAEAKKINKDNYLDIYIPEINNKRGTHLFFNTAKDGIKIGFYCRDVEFVENVLSKSSNIEKYAQGIRILNNPLQNDVEEATASALDFIQEITGELKDESEEDEGVSYEYGADDEEAEEGVSYEYGADDEDEEEEEEEEIDDIKNMVIIKEFIDKNIFFNLYNSKLSSDIWDYASEDFEEWDEVHNDEKIDYRNNFYGFVFPGLSINSRSDLKFGFINQKGEKIFESEFDSATKIVNGFSVVKKENQWFILNFKNNILKEVKYEDVSFFSEGLAIVMNEDGKYGYINEDGLEVIKCEYYSADSFSEGLAKVGKGDFSSAVYGFINQKGDEVIPLKYDFTTESVKEGLICVSSDSTDKYGYLDKEGNIKISFQYDLAGNFNDGLARVNIKGKWGYIDYNGKIIIPCEFERSSDFSSGLAFVRKDYDDYFINNKGENVISCDDYEVINSFNNNLAAVLKSDIYGLNSMWGFIDKNGKLVVDCIYNDVSDFCNGFTKVKKDDKWAIMNSDGDLLSEFLYESIFEFNEGSFVVGIPAKSSQLNIKEELTSFFNVQFGSNDWQNAIYPERNHRPTIGIYNAGRNELLALGLGRKDRIFTIGINFMNNKKSNITTLSEVQLDSFTQYDYGDITKRIMDRFEQIGSLHEDSCYTDDEEVRDGFINEMAEEIEILRELIPSIPEIDELSPGDF